MAFLVALFGLLPFYFGKTLAEDALGSDNGSLVPILIGISLNIIYLASIFTLLLTLLQEKLAIGSSNKSAPTNHRPKVISGFGLSFVVVSLVVLGIASYDGRSSEELLQEIDKRKEQCFDNVADMPPGNQKLAAYDSCTDRVTEEVLNEVIND
ncbi:hypothetical protein [Rhodococcus globerulus]|nr:hypothetical protein [Rhodococcus globerulus]PVX59698.1 hypothetical protein C8E04_6286 [Rhodococcus globerulus]